MLGPLHHGEVSEQASRLDGHETEGTLLAECHQTKTSHFVTPTKSLSLQLCQTSGSVWSIFSLRDRNRRSARTWVCVAGAPSNAVIAHFSTRTKSFRVHTGRNETPYPHCLHTCRHVRTIDRVGMMVKFRLSANPNVAVANDQLGHLMVECSRRPCIRSLIRRALGLEPARRMRLLHI